MLENPAAKLLREFPDFRNHRHVVIRELRTALVLRKLDDDAVKMPRLLARFRPLDAETNLLADQLLEIDGGRVRGSKIEMKGEKPAEPLTAAETCKQQLIFAERRREIEVSVSFAIGHPVLV